MELDHRIDDAWKEMERRRLKDHERKHSEKLLEYRENYPNIGDADIEEMLARPLELYSETPARSCSLQLEGHVRIETETLAEALERRDILDKRVLSFDVQLSSGGRTVQVETRFGDIDIETTPDRDDLAQVIFEKLLHWREEVRSPNWVVQWKAWSYLAPLLVALPLSILALTFGSNESERNAAAWQQEAWVLLEGGITAEEETKAIEVLLASQAKYPAPGGASTPPNTNPTLIRIRVFLLALIIACVAFAIPPKNAIGIGPGRNRLRTYRWWIRLVSVGVPVTLFASLILDPLLEWMKQSF